MNPWLELYCGIAVLVLDAASFVVERYTRALEWCCVRLDDWQTTHIVHVGPVRVKFHREYVFVYTRMRPLLFVQRGRRRR